MNQYRFSALVTEDEIKEALQINEYQSSYEMPPEIRKKRLKDMSFYLFGFIMCLGVALILWLLREDDRILHFAWKACAIVVLIAGVWALNHGIRRITEKPTLCESPKELLKCFYVNVHCGSLGFLSPIDMDISFFLLSPIALKKSGCKDFKEFQNTWQKHIKQIEESLRGRESSNFHYSVEWVKVFPDKTNPRIVDGICQLEVVRKRGEGTTVVTTYPTVNILYKSKAIQHGEHWYMLSGLPS